MSGVAIYAVACGAFLVVYGVAAIAFTTGYVRGHKKANAMWMRKR